MNYDVKSIYDDKTLRTTNKYNKFLAIYDDGLIVFDSEGYRDLSSLQRKKITDLSSSDFDKLMDAFLKTVKEGEEKIADDLKKGGFTPEVMPVFLNAKNVIQKDFERQPFVMQMDGKGAANEASKLTLKAKEEGNANVQFDNVIEYIFMKNRDGDTRTAEMFIDVATSKILETNNFDKKSPF